MTDSMSECVRQIAVAFSSALVDRDFIAAYELLARADRNLYTPDSLEQSYSDMISYFTAPAEVFEELHVDTASPMISDSDLGWVYVSIVDEDGDNEAVSFIVCDEDGKTRLRNLEWGRP